MNNNNSQTEEKTFEIISHPICLLASLKSLMDNDTLCDVCLVVSDKEFRLHRLVLAANSPYFARMFGGNMKESSSLVVELKDVTVNAMEEIIRFCYTSTYSVNNDNVFDILAAADMLQFPAIVDGCCKFLERKLDAVNCLNVFTFAELYNLTKLRDASLQYAREQFRQVSKTDEFKNASLELVTVLLSSDHLNIFSEKEVFDALVTWVNEDTIHRKIALPQLLQHVRLPLIPPKLLVDWIEKNPLVEESDACIRLVNKSKTCHLFPVDCNVNDKWLLPRDLNWDAKVYIAGGEFGSEVFDHFERLGPKDEKWTTLAPLSSPRDGLGIAGYEGKIYVAGGFDGTRALSVCEVYDVEKDRWGYISAMNCERHAFSLVEHQGWLYALGGSDYGSSVHSSVEKYDPVRDNWTKAVDMISKREGISSVSLHGCIYALGGDNGVNILNTAERFDPRTGHWYKSMSMGYRRRYFGACVVHDKIFVAGGSNFEEDYNSVEVFDVRANRWQPLPSMSKRRESLALIAIGDKVIAFGGACGNKEMAEAEVYDPIANNWETYTSLRRPKEGMGAIVLS